MRFEAVNPNEIKNNKNHYYRNTKILAVLNEFVNAEIPMAKVIVDNGEYKNFNSAQSSVKSAIKRFHFDGVSALVINGELYLMNKILMDKEVKL